MRTTHPSRRGFFRTTAAITAATGLPAWFVEQSLAHADPEKPRSPNDKPNVALIGCGGRGTGVAKEASAHGNVVAVCDVDARNSKRAAEAFKGAKEHKDYRQVIDRKDVDVVVNGTPDHWHTLVNVAAVKAGKDVYSEKPLTLTVDEGKRLVAAVRESKRVLQTGSQQRSDARFRLACELVRNGRLGKLTAVTTVLPAGVREGPFKPGPVPAGLDWDFWQGPTPDVPYTEKRCHFWFRYWYEYSGGTMTDWGAHHNDIALWGLGLDRGGPETVEGKTTVEPIAGGFTAASEYEVTYTYANGVTHRCVSTTLNTPTGGLSRKPKEGELAHGVKFEGPDGWIFVTRGKIEASRPEILSKPLDAKTVELYVSSNHMGNFFDCVRSRKAPVCDAETGHRSASICHLGVIAIRLGRKLNWDPSKEVFRDDKEANAHLAREMRKPYTLDAV